MKHSISFLMLALLITLLMGCGPSADQSGTQEPAHDHGAEAHAGEVEFNPGKGLGIPPVALASLGVVTEEVGSGKVTQQRILSAQVFRQSDEKSVNGRYRQGHAYATVLITSVDLDLVQTGQSVQLSDANGALLNGTISRIDTQLQEMNGQSELIIEIKGGDGHLTVGSALTLLLSQSPEKIPDTLVIPEEAILKSAKGTFAYVENTGFFLRTPVKTGAAHEGKIQILDGLFEGDVVVVRGTQGLYLTELQAVNAGTGCTHGH